MSGGFTHIKKKKKNLDTHFKLKKKNHHQILLYMHIIYNLSQSDVK